MASYSLSMFRTAPTLPGAAPWGACTAARRSPRSPSQLDPRLASPPAHPRSGTLSRAQPSGDSDVSAEFARLLNAREAAGAAPAPSPAARPSHLLAPPAAVAAVMEALQRVDYPDPDAGIDTAFAFTKPWRDGGLAPPPGGPRRSWAAREEWLSRDEFREQLRLPPFSALLECDGWALAAPLVFPQRRSEARCVQAVAVTGRGGRRFAVSFCMEREEEGSMKGCWLVAGVRQGDYSV